MIKILSNPKNESYFKLKERVLSSEFVWTYSPKTIVEDKNYSDKFKEIDFYSHCVIERPTDERPFPSITSTEWQLSSEVFTDIMVHNDLPFNCIYRINFNCTSYFGDDLLSPPHIDHRYPHNNLIIYLTDFSNGFTHIFNKTWPKYDQIDINPSDMKYSFKGNEDDIITFDGFHYHCIDSPKLGERRIVMIVTYLI